METNPAPETEQVAVPLFKTRTILPEERDLILKVLDESFRIGKLQEYYYPFCNDLNHGVLNKTSYLERTLKEKKELFAKLDQRSYTYNRILDTAKLALRNLQDTGRFNYYSAELIVKFIQLEEIFAERNLKSTGVRFLDKIDKEIKPYTKIAEQVVVHVDENDIEVKIPMGMTGESLLKFQRKQQAQADLGEAMKSMSFDDTEIDMDAESKQDITKMDFQ